MLGISTRYQGTPTNSMITRISRLVTFQAWNTLCLLVLLQPVSRLSLSLSIRINKSTALGRDTKIPPSCNILDLDTFVSQILNSTILSMQKRAFAIVTEKISMYACVCRSCENHIFIALEHTQANLASPQHKIRRKRHLTLFFSVAFAPCIIPFPVAKTKAHLSLSLPCSSKRAQFRSPLLCLKLCMVQGVHEKLCFFLKIL